jgi:anaerobic ribonucleoside-triphosphate reductase activating protein
MINIHRYEVVENEHLYGPGKRLLLFTQGCSLRCKGCTNQHLWEFGKGIDVTIEEILNQCTDLDGITLHGGEPLDQANVLVELIKKLKQQGKTVILFTGYIFKELNKVQKQAWLSSDMVISGRYEEQNRNIYLQFRGSTNQKVFTHKGKYKDYKIKDGQTVAILSFNEQGEMQSRGFRTDELEQLLNEISKDNK